MFCALGRIVIFGVFLYCLIRVIQAHAAMNSEEGSSSQH
jgi:hypothetical protein